MSTGLSNLASLPLFGTETVLVVTILAVLVLELAVRDKRAVAGAALLGTLLATLIAFRTDPGAPLIAFQGMLAIDPFARFFKILVLVATVIAILMGLGSSEIRGTERSEFFALVLATSFGSILLAAATDLVMLYLSLETVSLLSYVLATYVKGSRKSAEAGLKYVIYGGVASGMMIYGLSLLYGMAGSTSLTAIHHAVRAAGAAGAPTAFMAIVLSLAGFGYKIASVPFHMWAPDVYQGAPTPVTAYFSVVPKAAGFAALVRFFFVGFADPATGDLAQWQVFEHIDWVTLLKVVCVLTMTVGNLAAMPQRSLKRMLAYSSIAHAGYVLMGVVVLSDRGLEALMAYLFLYLFMNFGAFLVVLVIADQMGSDDLESFRGLFWRGWQGAFVASTALAFFFALVGVPPTAGFTGKYLLFVALFEQKLYWIAVVAILNTLVSVYYYFKVFQVMFLADPERVDPIVLPRLPMLLLAGLALPTIFFGLFWDPIIDLARTSVTLVTG